MSGILQGRHCLHWDDHISNPETGTLLVYRTFMHAHTYKLTHKHNLYTWHFHQVLIGRLNMIFYVGISFLHV